MNGLVMQSGLSESRPATQPASQPARWGTRGHDVTLVGWDHKPREHMVAQKRWYQTQRQHVV